MFNIRVSCIVKPTEDLEKVKKAVENVFNGEIVVVEEGDGYYHIQGFSNTRDSLVKLYNLIRVNQIIPATRSYLLKNTVNGIIRIMLHKQAAYVNKISLIDYEKESPLGPIIIEIETDNHFEVIDWLAPETSTSQVKTRDNRRSND